jgi:DNA-binding PadR family transcriptional regulator
MDSPGLKRFLPLTPATFNILLTLAYSENHGYAIIQVIKLRTGGEVRMNPGTLYGLIKRMLAYGWIGKLDECPDPAIDDERCRYYRLTDLGQRVAAAEAELLTAACGCPPAKTVAIQGSGHLLLSPE